MPRKGKLTLPRSARISVARLRPTDVIVVECKEKVPLSTMERIRAEVGQYFQGHRIVVFDGGLRMKIAPGRANV